jgi:hypothetical protein
MAMDRREEIQQIIMDRHGEVELQAAWEIAFQDGVRTPFRATLFGTPVEVEEFRSGPSGNLQCCVTKGEKQRWIGIEDLDETGLPADFLHILDLYQSYLEGDY